jgi:hypothetical protein
LNLNLLNNFEINFQNEPCIELSYNNEKFLYTLGNVGKGEFLSLYPYKNASILNKQIERNPIFSLNNKYEITIKELLDHYQELEENLEKFNILEHLLFLIEFYLETEKSIQFNFEEKSKYEYFNRLLNFEDGLKVGGKAFKKNLWYQFLMKKYLELLKKIIQDTNKEYSINNIPIKIKRVLNVFDLIKAGDKEKKWIELDNKEYYWKASNEKVNLILENKNDILIILDGKIKSRIERNLEKNVLLINIS